MLTPLFSNRFQKDYALLKRRGKNLEKLQNVIKLLADCLPLEPRHRDHPLVGEWNGYRDCHIEPDWILIYRTTDTDLILERTGTHSDLF